jgi:hypothetical protein
MIKFDDPGHPLKNYFILDDTIGKMCATHDLVDSIVMRHCSLDDQVVVVGWRTFCHVSSTILSSCRGLLGLFCLIIPGKRAVGSAQLIVPAMFHGSTSCGTDGIIYEFFTQPVRVVLA